MMRTRFAPSPNGRLHLGHAYAAICAHDLAREQGGEFYLRIEDIDGTRSRPELVQAIFDDLGWLGLEWDGPVVFQSERLVRYNDALQKLRDNGLVYPCFCTRRDIAQAQALRADAGNRVEKGPDGDIYPGTCQKLGRHAAISRQKNEPHVWRLDMAKAVKIAGPLCWNDRNAGEQRAVPDCFGDVVLARKDAPASYHLAATLDDAHENMTHIVRGMDLFASTHIHRLLQALLDLPTPQYWHHRLLAGRDGKKLSKSLGSAALSNLRDSGLDGRGLAEALRNNQLPAGIFWLEP